VVRAKYIETGSGEATDGAAVRLESENRNVTVPV
jgi:hypothetical protein